MVDTNRAVTRAGDVITELPCLFANGHHAPLPPTPPRPPCAATVFPVHMPRANAAGTVQKGRMHRHTSSKWFCAWLTDQTFISRYVHVYIDQGCHRVDSTRKTVIKHFAHLFFSEKKSIRCTVTLYCTTTLDKIASTSNAATWCSTVPTSDSHRISTTNTISSPPPLEVQTLNNVPSVGY